MGNSLLFKVKHMSSKITTFLMLFFFLNKKILNIYQYISKVLVQSETT